MSRKNEVWAWNFIFDRTAGGTSLKWLSIIDEHTRECLCLKVARRMTSQDIEVSRGLFIAIATTFGYLRSLEGINNVEHGRAMALVSFSAASAFVTAGLSPPRSCRSYRAGTRCPNG